MGIALRERTPSSSLTRLAVETGLKKLRRTSANLPKSRRRRARRQRSSRGSGTGIEVGERRAQTCLAVLVTATQCAPHEHMSVRGLVLGGKAIEERNALSSPLEEILKRLEAIERRLTKLEAASAPSQPAPEASNASAFVTDAVQAPTTSPASPAPSRPAVAPQPSSISIPPPPSAAPNASSVAAGGEPKSYSPTATAPSTERLHPLSPNRGSPDSPFPDLSMLDEKVEPRRGPPQPIEARAAIEDYPRISTRIQQLWGSPECEAYLNNLVIDTRGNRKGFPPAVMEELLYLGRLARALVILAIDGDLWDTLDQVGDRR